MPVHELEGTLGVSGAVECRHGPDDVWRDCPWLELCRPMYKAADGLPLVGTRRCCLGVRPTGKSADVDLDPPGDVTGFVVCNRKGLSVSADWHGLPGYMLPEELNDGLNGADGKNMAVFVHGNGTGDFAAGPFAEMLEVIFKENTVTAGVIRPTDPMPLDLYQGLLEATREAWENDPS